MQWFILKHRTFTVDKLTPCMNSFMADHNAHNNRDADNSEHNNDHDGAA